MVAADNKAADNDGMQDQAAVYDGDQQEWTARDGRDSRVVMLPVAVEDGGGGRQRRLQMATAKTDGNGSRQQWQRTTTARKIGW